MPDDDVIHILLVEDNPADRLIIERLLLAAPGVQFHVIAVDRLYTAFDCLAGEMIEAVLLDLSLPDSYGLETCVQMRAVAPSLPIIVLTGLDDQHTALEAMHSGAQDYLVKGQLDANLLARSIRYSIERTYALEQQRRSDEHLRLVTEQLPAILWTTDRHMVFTSSIGTGLALLELQPDQVVGKSLYDYFRTEDADFPPIAAHRRALQGESISFDFSWKGHSFHVHVEPLKDVHRQTMGTIGIALDVSDQKRMAESLFAARHVQRMLFPRTPLRLEGFDVAGNAFAADETGGDYFDFIQCSDECVAVVVGDVAGHGLGPALLMAELRAYLRSLTLSHRDPGEILTLANQSLMDDLEEHVFITVFFAVLNPVERTLTYGGAGHSGHILKPDGSIHRLDSTGLPLGMLAERTIYQSRCIELEPADLVLILTDGFQEAHNQERELFGADRVFQMVCDRRDEPAASIIEALYREVVEFTGNVRQADDMTALIVKCNDADPAAGTSQ